MFGAEEWIRKVPSYYTGQINRVLLPLPVLGREGQGSIPPAPAQARMALGLAVPTGVLVGQAGEGTPRGRKRLPEQG